MKYRLSVLVMASAFAFSSLAMAQATPDSAKKADHAGPAHKVEKSATIGKAGEGHGGMPRHPGMKQETMLQRLNSAGSLKTFAGLLRDAGLDKTLEGTGEFTVFAPTDEAFKKLPADTLSALRQDKARLAEVLKNHIISGKIVTIRELAQSKGKTIQAESGAALPVENLKGHWTIANAGLTGINMRTMNGPIHEIDTVILPGSISTAVVLPVTKKEPPDKSGTKAQQK